jgi:hypothetical protein
MSGSGKFVAGAVVAVLALGQCGGGGLGSNAKAAGGGAAVGAAVGGAVGFGAGAGAAGAASGLKSGVKSRVEGGIKSAGKPRPNGPSRPYNPTPTPTTLNLSPIQPAVVVPR